ncbi:motility associated factor glycosyltransferase family protein [Caloranaerobacter sp. DY30410]|uniref:motility associated factor glycosyltransferase family protein n=1 Tax=Caloranaerobacter sp. DY30410 TaxID=3238305 RepID=UPI003D01BE31
MENRIYQNNVSVLKEVYGENIIDILSDECDEGVIVEKAKDGNYTLKIVIDGQSRYITSKYAPLREAKKFVDNIRDYDYETLFIVFGMGLGYHIVELSKLLGDNNKILVIEPSISVFKKSIELSDWTDLMKKEKVFFFIGKDIELISQFYDRHINELNVSNIEFLVFSRYDKFFPQIYKKAAKKLKECIEDIQVSIYTLKYFSNELNNNLFRNLEEIIKGNDVKLLKDKFKDVPAIIVSAGPSLDKNIKELKKAQGKAVIIAGGRTLKPLLDNGIKPDIVVSLDPGKGAYEVIKENLDKEFPLVTTVISQSDIIREYKGKKYFSNVLECVELINYLIYKKIDRISQGGSVANMSLSLADYMGCNPIILIGQDLAYTDGKIHAQNSTYEFDGNNENLGKDLIEIEDIYGNRVYTSKVWLSFLRWFELYIRKNTEKEYIDATEGGAKIKGTKIMTLKEAIEKYCTEEANIAERFLNTDDSHSDCEKITYSLKRLKELRKNLMKVKKKSMLGIKFSKKMLEYYRDNKEHDINNILKTLDEIDEDIKKYKLMTMGIYHLISPVLLQIYHKKEFRENTNETEKEKGIRLAKKSYALYEGIKDSIEQVIPLIDECIEDFEQYERSM